MVAMKKEDMEFIENKIIFYCKGQNITPYRTDLKDITLSMTAEEVLIQKELDAMIRYLWTVNDEDVRIWLWNNLYEVKGILGHDLPLDYVKSYQEFKRLKEIGDGGNINDPIYTERLCLMPIPDSDLYIYYHHMLTEGDFEVYTGKALRPELIPAYTSKDTLDFTYGIYLKDSMTMIGVAGTYPIDNRRFVHPDRMEGQYYIFKPYRRMGYAKEAMNAVIDQFFMGALKGEILTKYAYKHEIVYSDPIVLRIIPCLKNEASVHLAESLGMVKEGILHHFFESKEYTDAVSYYMDLDIYKKIRNGEM